MNGYVALYDDLHIDTLPTTTTELIPAAITHFEPRITTPGTRFVTYVVGTNAPKDPEGA